MFNHSVNQSLSLSPLSVSLSFSLPPPSLSPPSLPHPDCFNAGGAAVRVVKRGGGGSGGGVDGVWRFAYVGPCVCQWKGWVFGGWGGGGGGSGTTGSVSEEID